MKGAQLGVADPFLLSRRGLGVLGWVSPSRMGARVLGGSPAPFLLALRGCMPVPRRNSSDRRGLWGGNLPPRAGAECSG